MVYTVFVFHPHSQTVCVRVSGQHQVSVHLFCQFQPQCEGFICLRIGVADCWEIAVWQFLFRNHIDIFKSQFFQYTAGRQISSSVKRRIHNFQIPAFRFNSIHMKYLFFQFLHICIVHFSANNLIFSLGNGRLFVHGENLVIVCHFLDFIHNTAVMGRRNLGTVFPVHFISIILRRIVAGCNINACRTAQMTKGEGKLRRRPQRLKNISLDSICRQAQSRFPGKFRRHIPGIIGHCHAFVFLSHQLDIICQSLGGFPHHIDIHPVCSRADNPPETGRSEFQLLIKPLLNFLFIVLNCFQLRLCFCIKIRIFKPFPVYCFVVHTTPPYLSLFLLIITRFPSHAKHFYNLSA